MNELKIKCQNCQQNIEFPDSMMGQIINCPHCDLSVALNIPGYAPPKPTVPPPTKSFDQRFGKIKKVTKSAGAGGLIQILGLILLPIGIGIILIILGGRMAREFHCSVCGTKLNSKKVQLCPACHCDFEIINRDQAILSAGRSRPV